MVAPRKLPLVVLAIDIGGTKFASGLVSARGELLDRSIVLVDHDVGPEAHFKSLAGIVERSAERSTGAKRAVIVCSF